MNKLLNKYQDFNFSDIFKLNFTYLLIAFVSVSLLIVDVFLLSYLNLELFILPSVLVLTIIPFFFIYPKFWLYTVTFSTFIFFGESDKGISTLDIITGLFFVGGLFVWFFCEIFINKRRIIENHWEFLYLFLYLIIPFFYFALYEHLLFLDFIRGYLLYVLVLYYFPMKKILTTYEDWNIFVIVFLSSIFISSVKQIYYYYTNVIQNLLYAYQIGSSIRTNQLLFTYAINFIFLFLFEVKSNLNKIILFLFLSFNIIALITSFSRIFWIMTFICTIITFLTYSFRNKIKFIIILLLSLSLFLFSIKLFLKDNFKIGLQVLENRITSSSKGTKDISAEARFVEWEKVIKLIGESPLLGQGFNKVYSHNSPIDDYTINYSTIHNGYLFLFYNYGIPAGLIILYLFFSKFYQSIFLLFKTRDIQNKTLLLFAIYSLLVFFVVSFFTSEFHKRDDVFLIPLIFALVTFVDNNIKNENIITENTKKNASKIN